MNSQRTWSMVLELSSISNSSVAKSSASSVGTLATLLRALPRVERKLAAGAAASFMVAEREPRVSSAALCDLGRLGSGFEPPRTRPPAAAAVGGRGSGLAGRWKLPAAELGELGAAAPGFGGGGSGLEIVPAGARVKVGALGCRVTGDGIGFEMAPPCTMVVARRSTPGEATGGGASDGTANEILESAARLTAGDVGADPVPPPPPLPLLLVAATAAEVMDGAPVFGALEKADEVWLLVDSSIAARARACSCSC